MKNICACLNNLKNMTKFATNRFIGFFIRRWKDLTDNSEKTPKERTSMETEKEKEAIKEKKDDNVDTTDIFEKMKQELEELRNFKEQQLKKEKRAPIFSELKLDENEQKYLNLILDGMDGESDEEKIKIIRKELPVLFDKEPKNFELKVEKLTNDEKKKTEGINPEELRALNMGK